MENKIQILIGDEWIDIKKQDLKSGNHFRLIDLNGEQVINKKGQKQWIAKSDAHEKFGDWVIDIW